ncbi:MAG: FAD-dependent oxidoreductase [Erysipelotrichaceae bacterium]
MKNYDAIIIGFGKAGKTLANYLSLKGQKVALIEKSNKMYGGTCINVGCIPTKSLVHSAKICRTKEFGSFDMEKDFYQKSIVLKNELIGKLRKKNFDKLDLQENIDIYNGVGSFVDEHHIMVNNETINGEYIYINTGSKAIIPPIDGIKDTKGVYTSETLLDLDVLPKHLLILGTGYIALEFAFYFSDFGSKVTLLQRDNVFLPNEDEDISLTIKNLLNERNVEIIDNVNTRKVDNINNEVVVYYNDDQTIFGDALLVATGRKANTDDLNLDKIGLELLKNGGIKVDEHLQTNIKHIYAMGDVVGDAQFTYKSLDDFRVISSNLSGGTYLNKDRFYAYSVFIDPAFSKVGISEKQAMEKNLDVKVFKMAVANVPKAHVLQNPKGLMKVIVDNKTNLILGAALLCEESFELINMVKLVMDNQLPYTVLRDQIYTHPTMSEAFNDLLG